MVMTLLTPSSAMRSALRPRHSAGTPIAPTAMIAPWPIITRGIERAVQLTPAGIQGGDGDGAERCRRGDVPAALHVLDQRCSGPLEGLDRTRIDARRSSARRRSRSGAFGAGMAVGIGAADQ